MTFALEHPEMVSRLYLVNTMTYASAPEREARQQELSRVLEVERALGREAAAESAVLYRQPDLKTRDPERFQELYRIRLERFEGINRTMEAYLSIGDSLQERLAELKMPVFIAHGDADTTIPVSCSLELHQGIPDSELIIIPGAGHGLLTTLPEVMQGVIFAYLERVS